ncbi:MAG: hypothetical protein ACI4JC_02685 [Faecalibacterium sp.]
MRKDHLMIITDAGVTLHLGWDHNIPYHLDPINGVDIDLQLAQGVGQIGTTVERQIIPGVYRTLSGCVWGGDRDAELLLRALPYHTTGTLYLADKYFTRFVMSKTPYLSQTEPFPRFSMMLYCPKPCWYSLTEQSFLLGGFLPGFRFPLCYDSHRYSTPIPGSFVNVRNPGALPVPFTCTLSCSAAAKNPCILNVITGEQIGFAGLGIEAGDVVEIYRTTTDRLAVTLTRGGVTTNIFALLDEDSTLTELAAGDNLLKLTADSGEDCLQAAIRFYPMEVGVLPEKL